MSDDDSRAATRRTVLSGLTASALGVAGAGQASARGRGPNRDTEVSGVVRGVVEDGAIKIGGRRASISGTDPSYQLDGVKSGERPVQVFERKGRTNQIRESGNLVHKDRLSVEGDETYDVTVDAIRYTYIRPPTDIEEMKATVDELAEAGITDLFVETFFHGQTIYPSDVATEKDYADDYYDELLDYAHRRGMRIHAWIETLYWYNLRYIGDPPAGHLLDGDDPVEVGGEEYTVDGDLVTVDADGEIQAEGGKAFVSPFSEEVVGTLEDLLAELDARYDVDGISLDYIRFPGGTAPWAPRAYGYEDVGPYEPEMSDAELHDRRVEAVTDLVGTLGDVVDDDTVFSASVFPGYYTSSDQAFEYNKSQDWQTWIDETRIDWFNAMCYALAPNDLERTLEARREEIEFVMDAQRGDVTVTPLVAITSGHPDLALQYDELLEDEIGAGYGLWKAPAALDDDSYDGEVP
ncbi:MAG TPA: family 10 glycosylhydrolase [Natronoarchaeum rubrum]|nr:family 10 glycosylhydrolase [Natronoarchaeum rubrum]